jgi:class 3 adenylate cyclase
VDSLSVKRRLSCILAADAVGYSSQMGRDEEGTVRVLSAHRAVIDGIIAFHEGRIVSTAGDSVLAEFPSVVEAVRCAVEIQEAIKTRNNSLADDHQMLFRVGINLGDVVVKNNDLLGDGVNVAARLESIAEPGGICISSSVYDQITGKLDLGFEDMGEQTLKNISRPIRAYRMSGITPPPSQAVRSSQGPKRVRSAIGAIGATGVVAVAVAFAWQTGWLRIGSPGSSVPTAIVAPAISQPSDPPAKEKAPVGIKADADAKRTPSEIPSQRVYSTSESQRANTGVEAVKRHADALRRQAELGLARAHPDAPVGQATVTIGGADAIATRPRTNAAGDANRFHPDAAAAWSRGPNGPGVPNWGERHGPNSP